MPSTRRLCVYCGSSDGVDRQYREAASELGAGLGAAGIGLVFGGGRVGLMGALADAALAAGGEVVGVIPRFLLDREVAHEGVTQLEVVESMHERKARMATLGDAFLALPGGAGTLEELFEVWTWQFLGLHRLPVGLLDVAGYWQPLLALAGHMVETGFLRASAR